MYIPIANRVEDAAKINAFLHAHGFATVITQRDGVPFASHLPMLLDEFPDSLGQLRGHLAKANEQSTHLDGTREILCIFHGPHAYISPSWYVSKVVVPTWNYAAVHVYGIPTVHNDAAFMRKVVDDTTEKYESHRPQPWKMHLPDATVDGLLKAIVGFSMRITRIEAKFKLGQNKSAEDQASMLAALTSSPDQDAQGLGTFTRAQSLS